MPFCIVIFNPVDKRYPRWATSYAEDNRQVRRGSNPRCPEMGWGKQSTTSTEIFFTPSFITPLKRGLSAAECAPLLSTLCKYASCNSAFQLSEEVSTSLLESTIKWISFEQWASEINQQKKNLAKTIFILPWRSLKELPIFSCFSKRSTRVLLPNPSSPTTTTVWPKLAFDFSAASIICVGKILHTQKKYNPLIFLAGWKLHQAHQRTLRQASAGLSCSSAFSWHWI